MSLEKVAQRARVSPATVSRVLNNIGVVKSSTRTRVLKAIEELKARQADLDAKEAKLKEDVLAAEKRLVEEKRKAEERGIPIKRMA